MNKIIQLSVIDRLTDDKQNSSNDFVPGSQKNIELLKMSVKRDLENLLNAKCPSFFDFNVDKYPMARKSILFYGLTDFTTVKTEDVILNIKETICNYEPRLERVFVESINVDLPFVGRYLIRANLKIQPHPIPISFDVNVDKYSSIYILKNRE